MFTAAIVCSVFKTLFTCSKRPISCQNGCNGIFFARAAKGGAKARRVRRRDVQKEIVGGSCVMSVCWNRRMDINWAMSPQIDRDCGRHNLPKRRKQGCRGHVQAPYCSVHGPYCFCSVQRSYCCYVVLFNNKNIVHPLTLRSSTFRHSLAPLTLPTQIGGTQHLCI